MKHNKHVIYRRKRHHSLFLQVRALLVCGLIVYVSASGQNAPVPGEPSTLTVHTGRPLAEMLNRVQALFLTPVNYEEVPHESISYLKSTTITKRSGAQVLLAPAVAGFSVTLGKADSSAYLAAQSVLNAHKSAGLPGDYEVVQRARSVDIVPVHVLAASGTMQAVAPVMSWPVTIPFATRRIFDVLQLLVENISKESGSKVILLNVPFAYSDTIDFGAAGEPARDVIDNLGAKVNRPISFQCLYDATEKAYYLNLTVVAPAPVPGTPASEQKTHAKPDGPRVGPPDSPFFIKTK